MKRCFLRLILLPIALSSVYASAAPAPALPVLLLAGVDNLDLNFRTWLSLIYSEALRRVGYQMEYRVYPAKRASALADSGAVDGEIQRVKSYGAHHPNLLRVPIPHFSGAFSAYALEPLKLSGGWSSLADSGLRVEYLAGVTYCEQMLPPVVPAALLSTAYEIKLGLRKLERHRSDVFIDLEFSVEAALQSDEFKNAGIHKIATMEVVDGYAYLNKRHADLVPRLAHALSEMKREGLIERYRKQVYGDEKNPPGGEKK